MKEQVNEIIKRYRRRNFVEHMFGPVGSVIFHIIIIVAAIKLMVFKSEEKAPEIEVMMMEPDAQDLEEFEEELEELEEVEDMTDVVAPPEVQMDVDAPPDINNAPSPSEDMSLDIAALDVSMDIQGPLVMKGLYAGRGAAGRASSLGRYGGGMGAVTEAAVLKALEWLKKNQAQDGSWGPNKPAMTGLGLLTFLAHGETISSEKYGQTVEKAIQFLVKEQKETGEFIDTDNQSGPYAHAIATYGISEAYGLTKIPAIKPVMEKAVEIIINGQQPGGGWDYKYGKTGRRDSSVAAWQIQALKAAYIAGSDNPRIKPAMEKAAVDLVSAFNPETGHFYYTDKGSHQTDSVTALCVLCLQLMGKGDLKEARRGYDTLKQADCSWDKPPEWALYAWYYVTQARFQGGSEDPSWQVWNKKFATELTRNQNPDGSWTSPSASLASGKEVNNGLVYCTTLAALTLQVYYRFLPTYKEIKHEEPAQEQGPQEGDVSVEII